MAPPMIAGKNHITARGMRSKINVKTAVTAKNTTHVSSEILPIRGTELLVNMESYTVGDGCTEEDHSCVVC